MIVDDTLDPATQVRLDRTERDLVDHEARIRMLERAQWKLAGAAACASAAMTGIIELLLLYLRH